MSSLSPCNAIAVKKRTTLVCFRARRSSTRQGTSPLHPWHRQQSRTYLPGKQTLAAAGPLRGLPLSRSVMLQRRRNE